MIRAAIEVHGVVQGVGFRPFIHALATSHRLAGFVRNRDGVVEVEVEGPHAAVDGFLRRLRIDAPPLARIEDVVRSVRALQGDREFRIVESSGAGAPALVPPDIAACAACVDELFDPRGRRFRYPFVSCTACGPRLTVAIAGPYDRQRTTFAAFPMCAACAHEYADPADRRFHAQTIACPACGPRLACTTGAGDVVAAGDAVIAHAAARLGAGDVVAIKGVGGYHLAIDARSEAAARRLRARKQRDDKPFAIMAPDLATAAALVELDAGERVALIAPARPIVLARRRAAANVADAVAPGSHLLGVMLPGSPLQHLLAAALPGVPLVMTSGNRSDEPIAHADADARARLAGIADLFVVHDLAIHDRCDDAVVRAVAGSTRVLRRARGYAPAPMAAPAGLARPTLAVGGQLKSVFALTDGRRAISSHHLGDLDHLPAYRAFTAAIERYEQMTGVRPERVVCDRHPDYASTRWARSRGLEVIDVQHHAAHVLACLAEHGADAAPAIGVAFDGTGHGDDGAIWGGEILIWDGAVMRRDDHLAYVPMPGGAAAVREPWRMAIAHLAAAGADVDAARAPGQVERLAALALIGRRLNTPLTSSMGRLFDAVAAVAGIAPARATFDGHAAMALESLAARADAADDASGAYPIRFGADGIEASAIVAAAADDARRGAPAAVIARRFHTTVVVLIAAACDRARMRTGIGRVALSGGVFANAIVLGEAIERLTTRGFTVLAHRDVPTGDGGLWLGQLAFAAALDREEAPRCA